MSVKQLTHPHDHQLPRSPNDRQEERRRRVAVNAGGFFRGRGILGFRPDRHRPSQREDMHEI